ncbi:MAG: hypothetical protein ACKUBY_02320 [Candidatus Moraniibacteriota bacterium]|jgi:homoaconitase/3-isopropylmalate dehydratase large subunit
MQDLNTKIALLAKDLQLDEVNETKRLSLLEEIGDVFTHRIILRLIKEVPEKKRVLFIEKINENKDNPDKILLFIDHFVEDADRVIDEEVINYKLDLKKISQT